MNAKYLRDIHFHTDLGFLPRDENRQIRGAARETGLKIDAARSALFLALTSHIHHVLRAAKRSIGDLPIRDVTVCLSADPGVAPEVDLRHGRLDLEIDRDPRDLLAFGDGAAEAGEWAIGVVEQALDRLLAWDSRFPAAVVRQGIDAFRTQGHAFAFRAGERMIPGTRVKGRIQVVVSCVDTRRYFSALYRGKPLLRVALPAIDRPDIQLSSAFSGFQFANGVITIPGHRFWPLDEARRPDHMKPVEINLRDHPQAYGFMRDKGWVDGPAGG